jgi:glycosyltransferase involved in cell wall biosynthesis
MLTKAMFAGTSAELYREERAPEEFRSIRVHNFYAYGGGEDRTLASEVALLRSHGHVVAEFYARNDSAALARNLGAAVGAIWNPKARRRLDDFIDLHDPSIVHMHNLMPLISPSAYYACRKRGVPVVQHIHNYRTFCPAATLYRDGMVCEDCLGKRFAWPALVHRCYRKSLGATAAIVGSNLLHDLIGTWRDAVDAFVCMNEFTRLKIIEAGFPAGRIHVKPHFVFPDPGPGKGEGGFGIFVGRLDVTKGLGSIFEAWRLLKQERRLMIVGEGPMDARVRQFCEERLNVEWLGPKPYAETLALIGKAQYLVFPSEWYEPFGRVIIEAFARGTPVLAANIGGTAELIEHGSTGLLFRPRDGADLARAVEMISTDQGFAANSRVAARASYESRFTAERNYHQLMAIYTHVQPSLARHHAASLRDSA